MNAGIDAATGDIIAHLHSDDYYANPFVIGHVAQAIEETNAEWVFGRCLSDVDGNILPENHDIPNYTYRRLLKGNFIPHPATFVRKSLFMRAGYFNEKIKYAMDYDLWLRLGKLATPIQLDKHLAVFRRHDGSLSSANPLPSFEDDFKVRMNYAGYLPWTYAYHYAHYYVRRRRILRAINNNE